MSSIHLELLDKKRLAAFNALGIFKDEGALAGGTALSLQIEHRHSFDFDIFLEREIKRKDFSQLKNAFEIRSTELSQKKFGVEFNPKLFLERLVYFKDLQITKTSFIKESPSPKEIQHFLKDQARKFTTEGFLTSGRG